MQKRAANVEALAAGPRQDEARSNTRRDTAEGKSFETWVKKYHEKKAAGEKNIRIEPEALD